MWISEHRPGLLKNTSRQLPAPDFLTANNTAFTNVAAVTIEDQRVSENTTFDITGPDGEISAGQRYDPDSNGCAV